VSQEVYVVAILLRHALSGWISSAEDMLSPLFIMEGNQFYPFLKVFILPLDDSLLPFLVMSDIIIGVKSVMTVMASHFVTLRVIIGLQYLL
jgi:hypothetical protein